MNREGIHRLASLILAGIYLAAAFIATEPLVALRIAIGLILPMACIWFPEPIGSYTGFMGRAYITQKSPAFIVRFMGWMLMLTPFWLVPILWVCSR